MALSIMIFHSLLLAESCNRHLQHQDSCRRCCESVAPAHAFYNLHTEAGLIPEETRIERSLLDSSIHCVSKRTEHMPSSKPICPLALVFRSCRTLFTYAIET